MKSKNLQERRRLGRSKFIDLITESNILAKYVDGVIRGLMFVALAYTLYALLTYVFNVESWLVFPIIFTISILISIIFSKQLQRINFGIKVQQKYVEFLNKFGN